MKKIIALKALTLLITSLLLWGGCRKDDLPASTTGPEINILSPLPNATLKDSDIANVLAKITHTEELHQYGYYILNENTGDTVGKYLTHAHSKEVLLDENWINTLNGNFELKLKVEAIDHVGNKSSKEVKFRTQH